MNFKEAADIILAAPGVVSGSVHRIERLIRQQKVRAPGGAGVWIESQEQSTAYRVMLFTDKKLADREGPSFQETVAEAFAAIGLPNPLVRVVVKEEPAPAPAPVAAAEPEPPADPEIPMLIPRHNR